MLQWGGWNEAIKWYIFCGKGTPSTFTSTYELSRNLELTNRFVSHWEWIIRRFIVVVQLIFLPTMHQTLGVMTCILHWSGNWKKKKILQNQQKNHELDHVSSQAICANSEKLGRPVYRAALYMTDKQLVRLVTQAFVKYNRWQALLTGCAPSLSATLAFQSSTSNTCKPACSWVFL